MEVCAQKSEDIFAPYKNKRKSVARKKYLPTWQSVRYVLCSEVFHVQNFEFKIGFVPDLPKLPESSFKTAKLRYTGKHTSSVCLN